MSASGKNVWDLSERDFPWTSSIETQLGFLLRYAILAPSTKNSQPWAFSVRGNRIHLLADTRRGQTVADADRRELHQMLRVFVAVAQHVRWERAPRQVRHDPVAVAHDDELTDVQGTIAALSEFIPRDEIV